MCPPSADHLSICKQPPWLSRLFKSLDNVSFVVSIRRMDGHTFAWLDAGTCGFVCITRTVKLHTRLRSCNAKHECLRFHQEYTHFSLLPFERPIVKTSSSSFTSACVRSFVVALLRTLRLVFLPPSPNRLPERSLFFSD